jgi:hypothetical protein
LEFAGESFEVSDRIGLMPLLRFAHFARAGVDSNEMEGLASMYDILQQVIAESDWDRFQDHATEVRADEDELMGVIPAAIQLITARPTRQPSDSSDGLPTTSVSSPVDSSSQVIARLEGQGRPDLALIVSQAEASRRSA